jgi:hypothetical protein
MCNNQNVPSMTLQNAVLLQVKEFVQNKQTFSVHDITCNIRSKASSGDLEIPEVEVSGASFKFDIPHTKVKSLFNDLWNTGVFDPDFTLDRKFNGTYFEYTPSLVAAGNAAPQPGACTSSNTSVATPAVTIQSQSVPTPVVQTPLFIKCPSIVVKDRISLYLEHCRAKNFRPTIKQVQSAIKRNVSSGWSCAEIQDVIENDLGYTVVADPDFVSISQVAVV